MTIDEIRERDNENFEFRYLPCADSYQDRRHLLALVDELGEMLRRYIGTYPAFRIKPIGAPGSDARKEQELLMALEEQAQTLLSKVSP